MERKNINFKSGQAILIVVLITVVALTIGLSIAGRTTTDVKITAQMQDSQRAFSAAEAGIESALLSGSGGTASLENANYTVRLRNTSETEFVYWGITKEDTFQLWLADHDDMTNEVYNKDRIRIGWGSPDSNWQTNNSTPAIEVIILYKDGLDYKLGKYMLDPSAIRNNKFCKPIGTNCPAGKVTGFITSGETIGQSQFQFAATLSLADFRSSGKILQFIRGKLFYCLSEQSVGFKALDSGSFPKQGTIIESVGSSGETTRKIQVLSGFEILPGIFDFSIFSNQELTQ